MNSMQVEASKNIELVIVGDNYFLIEYSYH